MNKYASLVFVLAMTISIVNVARAEDGVSTSVSGSASVGTPVRAQGATGTSKDTEKRGELEAKIKAEMQMKKDAMQGEVKDMKEGMKDDREEIKSEMKEKMSTLRTEAKVKLDALKTKIESEKNAAKKKVLEVRMNSRVKVLDGATTVAENIAKTETKISEQMTKAETTITGLDLTSARMSVTEAHAKRADANAKIDEAHTLVAGATVDKDLSDADKTKLKTLAAGIQADFKAAKEALSKALQLFRAEVKLKATAGTTVKQ